ncbi:MAG: hypothetical protein PHT96_05090 [Syntrophorhabdaceae bacterium]|nr:hypothetical protein [Syntrophorhabdaceae bacterium]MDD4195775.1 hypothetical protein [Syntrophorhabdaceae bacterium]HOC45397.1 hypothetical protein [Syntrophorhabdaceae bacterium]
MKYLVLALTIVCVFILVTGVSYSQGRGMMGGYGGYGMGPGMMGGQGCWGPGMMGGYGYGRTVQDEQCQKFLDDTAPLRKELHDKRFQYWETLRNPKAKPDDVAAQEKAIRDLQEKIYSMNPKGCWW